MGNQQGGGVRERFHRGGFAVREVRSDERVGHFALLQSEEGAETLLQRIVNPEDYRRESAFDRVVEQVLQHCEGISRFLFLDRNKLNGKVYDLVFEYGDALEDRALSEEDFWFAVRRVVSALVFLETNGRHHPSLRKEYLLRNA